MSVVRPRRVSKFGVASASIVFAFVQVPALAASAPLNLFPPRVVGVGLYPTGIASADLDRDGHLDVMVTARNARFAAVAFGRGDGAFEPAIRLSMGFEGMDVVAHDLDADGFDDVVALRGTEFVVFMSQGGRSFEEGVGYWRFHNSGSIDSLAAADLNHDGFTDVIAGGDPMVVYLGNGDGTFGSTYIQLTDSGGEYFVAPGDFNGDGKTDFATVDGNALDVWMGNGDGTFVGPSATGVHVRGDGRTGFFNDDAHLDLVVPSSNRVTVLLGMGDGLFASPVDYEVPIRAGQIEIVDLDGDGDGDIVAMSWANSSSGGTPVAGVLLSNGDGTFESSTEFPMPALGGATTAGDFNRDGKPEIMVASLYSSPGESALDKGGFSDGRGIAFVLQGDGRGGFENTRSTFVGETMDRPASVVAGDFDGDGLRDFATASPTADEVSVVLGAGDGSFIEQSPILVGSEPVSMAAGQFDGAAGLDVVTANRGSSDLSVLLSQAGGSFVAGPAVPLGRRPAWVVTADFDGDDVADLATANPEAGDVSVLDGLGDGTFATPTHTAPGIAAPGLLTVAELNGDGILDLVVGNSTELFVLTGNGDGTFAAGSTLDPVVSSLQAIAAADMNRDGREDMVAVGRSDPSVAILYGNGAGGIAGFETLVAGAGPQGVVVADVDGNGFPDLIVTHFLHMITVYLNSADGFEQGLEFFGSRLTSDSRPGIAVGEFDGDGLLDLVTPHAARDRVAVLFNRMPVLTRFIDPTTMMWPRLVNYDGFSVYRGALSDLEDADLDGLPDGGYGACRSDLDPDATDNLFVDEELPASGEGYFYLMARVRDGQETELGTTSAGAPRTPVAPCRP